MLGKNTDVSNTISLLLCRHKARINMSPMAVPVCLYRYVYKSKPATEHTDHLSCAGNIHTRVKSLRLKNGNAT